MTTRILVLVMFVLAAGCAERCADGLFDLAVAWMGIDCVDCMFRLEKEFKIPEREFRLEEFDGPRDAKGVMVGVMAEHVRRGVEVTLLARGEAVPPDLWIRVRACIAATVSVAPEKVTPESRLIEDLGFA